MAYVKCLQLVEILSEICVIPGKLQFSGYHSYFRQNFQKLVSVNKHRVQRRRISVANFFIFLRLLFFCFAVAICDLLHTVEAMYGIPEVLTASGYHF